MRMLLTVVSEYPLLPATYPDQSLAAQVDRAANTIGIMGLYFAKKLAAEKKKAIKVNKQAVELRAALKAAGLSEEGVLARMNVALIEDLAYQQGVSVGTFKVSMNTALVEDRARERGGISMKKLKAELGNELHISKEVVEKFKALSGAGPDRLPHYIEKAEFNPLECAAIEKYMTSAGKFLSLREELAAIGLTKDGVVARMNKASVKSVEDFKILSGAGLTCLKRFVVQAELDPLEIAALGTYMSKQVQETAADDESGAKVVASNTPDELGSSGRTPGDDAREVAVEVAAVEEAATREASARRLAREQRESSFTVQADNVALAKKKNQARGPCHTFDASCSHLLIYIEPLW